MEVLSEPTLERSVEGSPKEDMVVSGDGIMEGKKREKKSGERTDRKRCANVGH